MKQEIIKQELIKKLMAIYKDKKCNINKFGLKRGYFGDVILGKRKISLNTANKILKIYNDYYKKSDKIENLFNIENIIGYGAKTIEIEFKESKKDDEGGQDMAYEYNESIFMRIIEKLLEMLEWLRDIFKNDSRLK